MDSKEYKELRDYMDKLERKLERIETALIGDEFQTDGFVHRLEKVERKTREVEYKVSRLLWISAGAGGATAFVFQIVSLVVGW